MLDAYGVTEANWRDTTARMPHFCISKSPSYVGRAVAALAADPDVARWSGKVVSSGQLAPNLRVHRHRWHLAENCWRYIPQIEESGLPVNDTSYR